MKKLFLGSIALTLFSISLTLIQFSCGDKVNAKPTTTQQQQGKILFTVGFGVSGGGTTPEMWIMNYDGTGKTQVPMTGLPQNSPGVAEYSWLAGRISPDGQTIFINGYNAYGNIGLIYSMSLAGTNVKQIFSGSTATTISDIQVY